MTVSLRLMCSEYWTGLRLDVSWRWWGTQGYWWCVVRWERWQQSNLHPCCLAWIRGKESPCSTVTWRPESPNLACRSSFEDQFDLKIRRDYHNKRVFRGGGNVCNSFSFTFNVSSPHDVTVLPVNTVRNRDYWSVLPIQLTAIPRLDVSKNGCYEALLFFTSSGGLSFLRICR